MTKQEIYDLLVEFAKTHSKHQDPTVGWEMLYECSPEYILNSFIEFLADNDIDLVERK